MVRITFNKDTNKLEVKLLGKKDDESIFLEERESCQFLGLSFDFNRKVYTAPLGKLNTIMKEMEKYEIELSEYDKLLINNKIDEMHELKQNLSRKGRLLFVPSLMKFPPK